jgi:NhaP-type Na+/H+ or K+/H+ antiporter
MMQRLKPLSSADKVTVAGLLVAAVGVVIQILSGHPYPTIPPVFFILLIPAALVAFGPWRWAPVGAVLAGLFLTIGLFASGASARLWDLSKVGGPEAPIGLWVQMLAVVVVTVAAIIATVQNYRSRTSVTAGQPE